jgi:hypothetical protein
MGNPLRNLHNFRFVDNRLCCLALIVRLGVVAFSELIFVSLLRLVDLDHSVGVSLHVIKINWFDQNVALF